MARNESLKIEIRESKSLSFGFANPDSRIRTLKIRIVDSFRKKKFPNYSIRFVSEGFVYESRILRKYTSTAKFYLA